MILAELNPNKNGVKTELEPCDDCISRQAVLDGLASIAKVKARSDAQKSLMGRVIFFVEQLPAVTPKEKTAEWYGENGCKGACEGYMSAGVICSQCGEVFCGYIGDYDFCPNCGAKMVEPQESEG